jgi:hypothetical protein
VFLYNSQNNQRFLSLNKFNLLIILMAKQCLSCGTGNGSLNVVYMMWPINVWPGEDNVALRRGFLRVLLSSPVKIFLLLLHVFLYLHAAVTRRTNEQSLGTFIKQCSFAKSENIGLKNTFTFFHSWMAVLLLRRLVAGISWRIPGFDLARVYVGSVLEKMALAQIFLRIFTFSFFNIFSSMMYFSSSSSSSS